MENLNETILEGNLTRDCGANERDFIYTQGGSAVATISVAVNSSKKQADGTYGTEVSYFDVKIYGKTAENLKPYLKKGQGVLVVGALKQDRWEKDGKKFDKVYINRSMRNSRTLTDSWKRFRFSAMSSGCQKWEDL